MTCLQGSGGKWPFTRPTSWHLLTLIRGRIFWWWGGYDGQRSAFLTSLPPSMTTAYGRLWQHKQATSLFMVKLRTKESQLGLSSKRLIVWPPLIRSPWGSIKTIPRQRQEFHMPQTCEREYIGLHQTSYGQGLLVLGWSIGRVLPYYPSNPPSP